MTNDTNTLNGALKELGETLASNLTTQGVPSTWDEGLTTLVGKVLDIGPSPTPTVDSLTLVKSAGKQILSYADKTSGSGNTEYCTVTATALDSNNQGVSGQSVVFKVGTTTVATETTDSNGEASYTYTSQGSGDVVLSAECSSLIQTYAISDDLFYDSMIGSVKNNWEITSGTTVSSDSTGTTFSYNGSTRYIKLPVSESSFVMEWDHITGTGVNKLGAETWNGTTWVSYCIHESAFNQYKIYTDSSSQYSSSFIENAHYKYVVDGNSHSFYVDGHLVGTQTKKSATGTFYIGFYVSNNTHSQKIKNVEIKPL